MKDVVKERFNGAMDIYTLAHFGGKYNFDEIAEEIFEKPPQLFSPKIFDAGFPIHAPIRNAAEVLGVVLGVMHLKEVVHYKLYGDDNFVYMDFLIKEFWDKFETRLLRDDPATPFARNDTRDLKLFLIGYLQVGTRFTKQKLNLNYQYHMKRKYNLTKKEMKRVSHWFNKTFTAQLIEDVVQVRIDDSDRKKDKSYTVLSTDILYPYLESAADYIRFSESLENIKKTAIF